MAEYSADTQAIIDRLKAEGDLARNSGTNSIRSVKINLDRFEGIFNTISSNIAAQTDILRVQSGIAQDQVERDRNKEQFDEVAPPEKDPIDDSQPKSKLISEEENKKINAMGDSIKAALSLKNIALAGAGVFIGYNLLKGFIDEKTGGGWTEFENNIGPFARSLPETMASMQSMALALPEQLRESSDAIKLNMTNMERDIGEMSRSVQGFITKMGVVIDKFTTLGGITSALIDAIGIVTVATFGNRILDRLKPRATTPRINPDLDANGNRRVTTNTKLPVTIGPDGKPLSNVPGRDPVTGKLTTSPAGQAAATAAEAAPTTGGGRGQIVEEKGARGAAMRAQAGQAIKNITDVENAIQNPKMAKIYSKLLKGFAVLGIAMTLYQARQLAALLDDDSVEESVKIDAVGAFIGELTGGATLSVGLGILGTTFGPWGTLIGALLGGVIGSFAGAWLGKYIARWAWDESPTAEDIAESRRQQGIDQYYEQVEARPTMSGHTGRNAKARWDSRYSETHNANGTPMNSRETGGRGNVVEGKGERNEYQVERDRAILDSLIDAEIKSQEQDTLIEDTQKYLDSISGGDFSRTRGLSSVSSASALGDGGTTFVNAPVIAPQPITVTNGGSQVTQVAFSGGAQTGGPSLTIYGLPGSIA